MRNLLWRKSDFTHLSTTTRRTDEAFSVHEAALKYRESITEVNSFVSSLRSHGKEKPCTDSPNWKKQKTVTGDSHSSLVRTGSIRWSIHGNDLFRSGILFSASLSSSSISTYHANMMLVRRQLEKRILGSKWSMMKGMDSPSLCPPSTPPIKAPLKGKSTSIKQARGACV